MNPNALNAVGPPDGKTVAMGSSCSTLQLTFTNGTIVPRTGQADLAIIVAQVGGITLVEVSPDGNTWTDVGFVGDKYKDVPPTCKAEHVGNQLLIHFDRCTYKTDVAFVRLQRDLFVDGGLVVDAVEALSFKKQE